MKRLLTIVLALVMVMSTCTGVLGEEISKKQVLRVGINAEYVPFEYIENGDFKGIDIDIIKEIADSVGYDEVEFVNMEFSELFSAVNEGVVDCAISTITYTEERDAVVDFTEPYAVAKVNYVESGNVTEKIEKYCVIFKEGARDNPRSKYSEINREITYWNEMEGAKVFAKGEKGIKVVKEGTEYDFEFTVNTDGTILTGGEQLSVVNSVYSDWAKEDMIRATEIGWVPIKENYSYNITRGEFCSLLGLNFLYSCGLDVSFWEMKSPFTDIDNGALGEKTAIEYLYCLDIIEGKSETFFCPNDYLTREEAAVIFVRIMDALRKWKIADINANEMKDWAYTDHEDISPWANNAVYTVSNLNIMQGTDKGFEPKNNLTYEQTIIMLLRLHGIRWSTNPSTFSDKINSLMPKDENYIFSPLSIKMSLMLAANGADDETQDEICALFDEDDVAWYNEEVKEVIKKYSESEFLYTNIANSVWVNKSKTDADFADEFKTNAEEFYRADVGVVDEANAVESVNNWVSKKTNGKIDSILPESYNDFYLALVNAIYFNGKWENKFDADDTKPGMFTNADGTETEIMFMNQTDYFNYYSDGVTKIVEMPYETLFESYEDDDYISLDLDIGMYLVMSSEDINVAEKIWYASEGADMSSRRVKMSIPKFEVEYSDSLKDELINLGLNKTFSSEFGNILENEPLFVNDILHKTYIKVDEEGTEAAAATAAMFLGMGMPERPAEFKADKPFYFVIRDNENGEILFMGRYAYAE